MSIVDEGRTELASQREQEAARKAYQRESDRKHCVHRFLMDFYRDHWIANPNYTGAYGTRMIVDPERPLPEVEFVEGDGGYEQTSLITCEGLTYRVTWEYHGGGDRADWDDGWWPEWELRIRRPFRFWPLRNVLARTVYENVYGKAAVARALEEHHAA